jgi:CRISPR-associated protein Cmr6
LTLHHIYGLPYIPASTIKGVVRSHILSEYFDHKENEALKDKIFVEFFGNQKQAGKIIFLDAFPSSPPEITPDVMNPHYGDYYSEKKPPADYLTPNPIFFLTVKKTTFDFYLLAKKNSSLLKKSLGDKKINDWLKSALHHHGIGAKTAVGYGYFEEE